MLSSGFADPVRASQAMFRAVLDAVSRPGTVQPIAVAAPAPAPLCAGAAAIALTLCDHDTPVWLDGELRGNDDVVAWLRFHCGCRIIEEPGRAAFAFAHAAVTLPPFDAFSLGTAEYPDRSTTLIVEVETLHVGGDLIVTGPGIRDCNTLTASPLPNDMAARLAHNNALFPRGVDLLLVSADAVAGLPRSVRVVQET